MNEITINPEKWTATGRRIVDDDGRMRAEMRRGEIRIFPYCRPHEGCSACVLAITHVCPMVAP